MVKLGDVCSYSKGKKPPRLNPVKTRAFGLPYINIRAFEKGVIDEFTDGDKCNLCEDGDLLMVWDGARAGYTGKAKHGAIGSTLMKIEPKGNLDKSYLFYFLQSIYKKINSNPRGVGIPHVEPSLLWNSSLFLPPLPIQQAIVSKIEELFSELDKSVEQLKTAQLQLKTYRQAVLKWAFEGRLTNEWVKEGELPKGWAIKAIKEIGVVKGGKRLPAKHKYSEFRTEYFYIMAGNLKYGTVANSPTFITKETFDALKNYRVYGGEVYITIVGACIGDAGIIPNNIGNAILTENAAKIIDLNGVNNKYLSFYLNSFECQRQIDFNILSATLGKLALSRILTLLIPTPASITEQLQIVSEIESRLSVADKLEESISFSLQQAESLRQSILKQAFEGKLI